MTKIIGLTGGIATGKSVISNYLKQKNIPIIDADQITHQVEKRGQSGFDAIVSHFGGQILDETGEIDRQRLARIVFSDSKSLKQLVRIIDPHIRSAIFQQVSMHLQAQLVVIDAPTLFENGYIHLVDEVVVVYCDSVTQLHRLMKRNRLSISEANARIKNQWPLQIKCNLANTIMYNSGTIKETLIQVDQWLANEID
ncbi:MAG: dephospho-CoA kinase [Lentilactobacillus diolivorans]|jgi:dephospho-CoA kinase|uniref:Dephospho-CoA kinase n=2 Tax=Lentilactobacillus diolivorans TaxID=179838 RepID=A0A0R1SDR9_9LACO|nr:dephospho-CoA kinase [Lentilactobacillus diolivorans]RRG00765.1 MAG: dephospho-CoA kinase [Lactobacillus sp.]KRL64578.1 dephospho-CoA kinase [Lentilactobacillus diolivorans DSM 14421]MCH4164563.1 dephospho-CoA kinase [Lentilactobacillus diolivorans]MDH5104270.1 dephospho-CoA kinase [Lentilactobacillus diolivorans]GEP22855.1 dephospho-CoA kinase [Lentilactobacillus diolivorans]